MNIKQLSALLFTLWLVVLLSWCGTKPDADAATWDTRSTLYITTQMIGSSGSQAAITKNAKVLWSSDIIITSQVAGRVTSIPVQLWQQVGVSNVLVRLSDTNGAISFGLQRNQVAFDTANNTYDIQKANLERQIADAQIALRRAQLSADTTRADAAKQLEKIDYDLSSVDPTVDGSNTQIQLDSLRRQLERAEFDYQTKLTSDNQTLSGFLLTAKNIHTDIKNLMNDSIVESDKILGRTESRRWFNDAYEAYLSAKDFAAKARAESDLDQLIWLEDELASLEQQWQSITIDNVSRYLQSYRTILTTINRLSLSMKDVLNATVASSALSQAAIDGLNAQYNGLTSRSSALTASITAQINGIESFLSVYRQNQSSLAQQVDLLKNQIALTEKTLNDAQFNTSLAAQRTRLTLDAQIRQWDLGVDASMVANDFVSGTKDLNLQSIQNQLRAAEIALAELNFNAAKFTTLAPIRGLVSDILVDVGQDVSPGTPLMRIVSNQQEIEISLTESEKSLVVVWQKVLISNQNDQTYGTIISLSKAADRNGNFVAKISVDDELFDVWVFVDVVIPVQGETVTIPVNAVSIVDVDLGQIIVRNGESLDSKTVQLGKVLWDVIQVITPLDPWLLLVISDVSNYDSNKQVIKLRDIHSN